jgi:hypothetical protein
MGEGITKLSRDLFDFWASEPTTTTDTISETHITIEESEESMLWFLIVVLLLFFLII